MIVTPFPIADYVPRYEEVAWVVHQFCLNRLGGLSIIRVEDLKACLQELTWEDTPDIKTGERLYPLFSRYFGIGLWCRNAPVRMWSLFHRLAGNFGG